MNQFFNSRFKCFALLFISFFLINKIGIAQNGDGPIKTLSLQTEFQNAVSAPRIVDSLEYNTYKDILLSDRFNVSINAATPFHINNLNDLFKLKDMLDIISSDRRITNGFKGGKGTSWEAVANNCDLWNPTNNPIVEDKITINYKVGGTTVLGSGPGTWPLPLFDINTYNSCNGSYGRIFYVNGLKQFGFGTDQPQATYHFATHDMLVGNTSGYYFKISNEVDKQHIRFGNNTNLLFLVNNEGKVFAKEFEVTLNIAVPDYVFASNYKLKPLNELETYINQNKHLPGIKSAAEFEEAGVVNINEMQMKLLEKVEELTLYTIQQENKLIAQQKEIDELKKAVNTLIHK